MQQHQSLEAQLLERYIQGIATSEETAELFAWLRENAPDSITGLEQIMGKNYAEALARPDSLSQDKSSLILAALFDKINRKEALSKREFTLPRRRSRRIWYSVAAAIFVILLGGYWFFQNPKQQNSPLTDNRDQKDIAAPSTNRAMITLDDGSQVFLDSADNGQLAQLGNVILVKLANGQIAYKTADGQILKELQYNTLTNPRGSKVIDMQLSDGSHVWLNAGSSITYPVVFVGNERKVELKGEGYFEVAKNPNKKFIVTSNGVNTEVLGTHFNVNAYEDESDIKVTLLEGSVKVSNRQREGMLKPGQQATLGRMRFDIQLSSPNIDQVMAWKYGFLTFNDICFEEIMKKIERWYDVKVLYSGHIPNIKLEGDLNQNTSLNGTLEALRLQGARLRLDGRTLIVD
ncbi:hypothetical protein A8C56_12445 [Niabella ginsenosidivorans]|uniref:Iron dicitrate transport regulator FecR n=1 Tax=Niabella ginsenosidivorans TaxID=1176587 RepID=A0A1A9I2X8_9BACT|nr:FecR family protein [Niabella ginsenosidivorans]ANH81685.1 hypothetical protein A8C56_12445 [Niabella ginsenosidivorans]